MAKLLLCLTLLSVCNVVTYGLKISKRDAHHWGYKDFSAWCHVSENCCGQKQSPIDLTTGGEYKPMRPFNFINYSNMPKSVKMTNNGHSVAVSFAGETIMVEGGGLPNAYIFDSFHFHWGKKNSEGSEHTIDGESTPLELHLVHYNSKYDSLASALASGDSDALAVLGVMYEINDEETNLEFRKVTSRLSEVEFVGSTTDVKPFALRELLPKNTKHFFRYNGSLTTPTCNEQVVWTVFQDKAGVTSEQLKQFRHLYATGAGVYPEKRMGGNFRPVQDLNGRQVIQGEEAQNCF